MSNHLRSKTPNPEPRTPNPGIMLAVVMILALGATAFGQDKINFSGEAKTGIYWEQKQQEGMDPDAFVDMQSKDDAGSGHGRYRLNIEYDNGKNFGMKMRLNWENWSFSNTNAPPEWTYAFGYGNFFDNQMTVSVGKLGASPWGTGGPEMWKELETGGAGGVRFEWKPAFVPGLNAGFVLNYFNSDRDQGWDPTGNKPLSLLNILNESILGVSYTTDQFIVRMAYRFDDEVDATQENKMTGGKGEDEFIYRLEEKVLKNYLPGLQVWAIGHLFGLSAERKDIQLFKNWLFVQYAPDLFTAQLRFGYEYITSRSDFYVKPTFYLNLFDKLLSVGASFNYCLDFGEGKVGKDYHYIEFEPKVQLNLTSSYIAFAYNFRQEYLHPWEGLKPGKEPLKQTQWMNLRFCIYF